MNARCVRVTPRFDYDPYQEENLAAFQTRAEAAIEQFRDEGDQHPVVLLIHVTGPIAHPLGRSLARRAEAMAEEGLGVQLNCVDSDVRAFVLPRTEARRLLESCGRHALGRDFRSLFAMTFEPWEFLKLTLAQSRVQVNLCSPAEVTA